METTKIAFEDYAAVFGIFIPESFEPPKPKRQIQSIAKPQPAKQTSDWVEFSGIATSGNPIMQSWSNLPVITDLGTLRIPKRLNLRVSHEILKTIGVIEKVDRQADCLFVRGCIFDLPESKAIIEESRRGIRWGLSIGCNIGTQGKLYRSPSWATFESNGRKFSGAYSIAIDYELVEISATKCPADPQTILHIRD